MKKIFYFTCVFCAWTSFAKYYPHWDCALADVAVRVVDETNVMVGESFLKGSNAQTYFMLDATNSTFAKYVPSDWHGYDPRTWAANWYTCTNK